MTLEIILRNHILYERIINNLDQTSRIHLNHVCKYINSLMKHEGYFKSIYYKTDTLDEYIHTLNLIDVHNRYLKRLVIYKQSDVFAFLPFGLEDKYTILIKKCYINITDKDKDKFTDFLRKVYVEKCMVMFTDTGFSKYIDKRIRYNI